MIKCIVIIDARKESLQKENIFKRSSVGIKIITIFALNS